MTARYLCDLFERFAAVLAAFAALIILSMSVWITYDVLTRYFLDAASPWAFDLSEYALAWITFLGAPWVLLQDRHVRIEILVDVLSVRSQRLLGIFVCAVALLACAVLTWRTSIAALEYYQNDVMMARIWRIPRVWPYIVVPFGSALLMLAFLVRIYRYVDDADPERSLRKKASAQL